MANNGNLYALLTINGGNGNVVHRLNSHLSAKIAQGVITEGRLRRVSCFEAQEMFGKEPVSIQEIVSQLSKQEYRLYICKVVACSDCNSSGLEESLAKLKEIFPELNYCIYAL